MRRPNVVAASALIIFSILLFCDYTAGARGGGGSRGGSSSRSGSSRSSSSRSSSISRSSSSTSVRVKVRTSTRYGNRYYVVAPSVHVVYGYSYYKSRHLYVSSRNDDPTVCYNDDPVDNGTVIGYFVCPLPDNDDSYTYCCGDDGEEYCCDFWGDSGRTAGAVIGILSVIVVIIVIITCVVKTCNRWNGSISTRKTQNAAGPLPEAVALNAVPTGGGIVGYVPQPNGMNVPAFELAGAPQPPHVLPYPPQPAPAHGGGLPYPCSPCDLGGLHNDSGKGAPPYPCSPYPAGAPTTDGAHQSTAPPYPCEAGHLGSIGFEGMAAPPTGPGAAADAGSCSSVPTAPPLPTGPLPTAPPSYSEAVKL